MWQYAAAMASATSGGSGQIGQSHSLLDHELYLRLRGASGADERLFDLRGRIADHFNARLRRGEEDHTPRVAHDDGSAGVLVVAVEVFHRHDVGFVRLYDVGEIFVQLVETLLDGFARIVFEHAAIHQARFVFVPIEAQDGIARHAQTGVDAQNAECVFRLRQKKTPRGGGFSVYVDASTICSSEMSKLA